MSLPPFFTVLPHAKLLFVKMDLILRPADYGLVGQSSKRIFFNFFKMQQAAGVLVIKKVSRKKFI